MDIRINGENEITAEKLNKYCVYMQSIVDESLSQVQSVEGAGDKEAVSLRLMKIKSLLSDLDGLGEKCANILEKREDILNAYKNMTMN